MSRSNWLWPLLLIACAALLAAWTAGALPPTVIDLVGRSWPIVLVLVGLNALIGRRVRFSNFIVLGACIALTAGIIVVAYGRQAGKPRSDYRAAINQAIAPEVSSVRISVTTLLAPIEISIVEGRNVGGEFVGSVESLLTSNFAAAEGVGTLTITETRTSSIPKLDAIGRGKLTLTVPAGVTIDELAIRGGEGDLRINATSANLKNLNIRLQKGNIAVELPALPAQAALGGTLKTDSGDMSITIPAGLTVRFAIESGRPAFDQSNYLLLSTGELRSATGGRDFQAVLTLGASGTITVTP
jgi:hypothetical protein